MDYFKGTTKQISPCIASKAKYALNIKKKKPSNKTKCSSGYWLKVIESFSSELNIDATIKKDAINKYKSLIT